MKTNIISNCTKMLVSKVVLYESCFKKIWHYFLTLEKNMSTLHSNHGKIDENKVIIFNKIWVAIKFLDIKILVIKRQQLIQILKA